MYLTNINLESAGKIANFTRVDKFILFEVVLY